MRTKITVVDVVRIGACQGGLEQAIALGAAVGIPADAEVEFDVVLQTCLNAGNQLLYDYFVANKAALLEYTDSSVQCYLFQNVEYETVEAARAAREAFIQSRATHHADLTSVTFSRSLGEDHEWVAIDLSTFFVPPDAVEFHFHIFNHRTGLHEEAATLEEAKADFASMVQSHIEADGPAPSVGKKLVYAEDGVSTKIEDVE